MVKRVRSVLDKTTRIQRTRRRIVCRYRPAGSDEPPRTGFTEDLSAQGLFVQTHAILAPGTRLEIEVEIPGGEPISVSGRVVWAKNSPIGLGRAKRAGMGIRLDAPSPELSAAVTPAS